jgi:c-di-GMP-binding flagellar brake protein YcgR
MSDASTYTIRNQKQIVHNLSILVKNKCLLSVRFGEGHAFFLTAIIEINEESKTISFDYGPKEVLNQQLLKAASATFQADFSGIKVSFKGNMLKETLYNGEPVFTMPIPESIFWMQRREYFRIKSPRAKGSYCELTLEGQAVRLMLSDISLTGFSMLNTSTAVSDLLIPGEEIEKCKLVLADTGEDEVSIKICAKFIINPDKIAALKIEQIGCLFTKIAPTFETIVQRYINQLQRESIQKKNEGK